MKTPSDIAVRGDTYAVSQRFWEFSGFITAPIRLVIALVFLYKLVSVAILLAQSLTELQRHGLGCLVWSGRHLGCICAQLSACEIQYLGACLMSSTSNAHPLVQITRSSWKAKDARMGIVNELLQNIRFLKFYGWGEGHRVQPPSSADSILESHWSRQTEHARETELKWRVKENVVATMISFIWCASS